MLKKLLGIAPTPTEDGAFAPSRLALKLATSAKTNYDGGAYLNPYTGGKHRVLAGLVGGLGVVPGANYGDNEAVFEAVHGSAPDIAGQNLANPLALLMSAVMMLNYLAETDGDVSFEKCASLIKTAYDDALIAGETTKDLGGSLGTAEFADVLIARIAALQFKAP